ncbi:MAG: hypothetical protein J6N20_15205 [Pseudomonas sp.]|nr:hypothetical protein [Pseudomonas sp.]
MTVKCTFCKDTKQEPGIPGPCVWCEDLAVIPKCEDVVAKLDASQGREAALREELAALRESYEAMRDRKNSIVYLQQRLTSAEQREAELKKLLCDVINEAPTGFSALKVDLANRVNDALKPAAEGEGS